MTALMDKFVTKQGVLRSAFRLDSQNQSNSFMEGANMLLAAYAQLKFELLEYLLGDKFINFWRMADLNTLIWAILGNHATQFEDESLSKAIKIVLGSSVMKAVFTQLQGEDKVNFVERVFKLASEDWMMIDFDLKVRSIFGFTPYSTSFVLFMSNKDRFRDL